MNESTARADRYDLQTSTSSFFLWEVPQKPVAVKIPYELIDRLEREAVESFRSVTSRGSEIGGLLIGSTTPGSPMVVSIAEFQLIDCEYARGPLYRLSEADIARYQRAIEERAAKGAGIAGFFRTHTRKGISLDTDDLALLDAHFREPHQIALLVRPFATKASTAGIFIRESGRFSLDASHLEFPFRSPENGGKAAEEPEAKAAAPAPAKPAVRGQIVPIASRRDVAVSGATPEEKPVAAAPGAPAAPAPATAQAAAAAPALSPVEEVAAKVEERIRQEKAQEKAKADKAAAKAPAPAAKVEKPVEKPAEKPAAKEPEKPKSAAAAAPAAPAEKKEPGAKPATAVPEAEAPKSGKGLKLVLAALATTALFVMLFVYPGFLTKTTKTPSVSQQDGSPLQLRVERTNGELLLTWNRESAVIRNASKAVLSINDGDQHENVEMDLAQLRNGSIVYSPQGTDISFKMEVIGQGQDKTTSESVRVLRTRPSPLQDQTAANGAKPNAAPATTAAAKPAENTTAPAAPNTPAAAETTPTETSKPVTPTRPFKAESLGQRLRPTQASDIPDAPTVGGARVSSAAIPGVNLGNVAPAPIAPPPSAPAPAAPAPAATDTRTPTKSGGQIQQAVLISKKDPEYPKLARQTGAKGIVKLTAMIGKDGHVKSVKIISGHPMLQAAAADAVKQWIYKPTLLNGQPVEAETVVELRFLGDK